MNFETGCSFVRNLVSGAQLALLRCSRFVPTLGQLVLLLACGWGMALFALPCCAAACAAAGCRTRGDRRSRTVELVPRRFLPSETVRIVCHGLFFVLDTHQEEARRVVSDA